jgi:F-type H+-transporting ATPase subunit epsilon
MNLKILLPAQIFVEKTSLSRLVAETATGSFGILPQRLDCVAALVPGILTFENNAEGEVFVAIDEGVLVKTGLDVLVSVRNAILGTDLDRLHETVEQEFVNLSQQEQSLRAALTKIETGLIRRMVSFQNE